MSSGSGIGSGSGGFGSGSSGGGSSGDDAACRLCYCHSCRERREFVSAAARGRGA